MRENLIGESNVELVLYILFVRGHACVGACVCASAPAFVRAFVRAFVYFLV